MKTFYDYVRLTSDNSINSSVQIDLYNPGSDKIRKRLAIKIRSGPTVERDINAFLWSMQRKMIDDFIKISSTESFDHKNRSDFEDLIERTLMGQLKPVGLYDYYIWTNEREPEGGFTLTN